MDFRHSIEMSISREEFLRLLPAAVEAFQVDADTICWSDARRRWTIRLVPLAHRRMASAVLPRHRVEFLLEACSATEGAAFLERFHRAFLRGGG